MFKSICESNLILIKYLVLLKSFPSQRISPGIMSDQPKERLSRSNTEMGAVIHDMAIASNVKNAHSWLQHQCTYSYILCDQLQRACFITDQNHLLAVASNININRNIIQQVQCVFSLLQRFLSVSMPSAKGSRGFRTLEINSSVSMLVRHNLW